MASLYLVQNITRVCELLKSNQLWQALEVVVHIHA